MRSTSIAIVRGRVFTHDLVRVKTIYGIPAKPGDARRFAHARVRWAKKGQFCTYREDGLAVVHIGKGADLDKVCTALEKIPDPTIVLAVHGKLSADLKLVIADLRIEGRIVVVCGPADIGCVQVKSNGIVTLIVKWPDSGDAVVEVRDVR